MAKGRKTGGRKKGAANVMTAALKDVILQALDQLGGVTWLVEQGHKNPNAVLALIGRVLPLQIKDGGAEPMMPTVVKHVYESEKSGA